MSSGSAIRALTDEHTQTGLILYPRPLTRQGIKRERAKKKKAKKKQLFPCMICFQDFRELSALLFSVTRSHQLILSKAATLSGKNLFFQA